MPFTLTEEEKEATSELTAAAYNAWVLVNDYFSWDKEWKNYQANGSVGEIVSGVFLFMKWYSLGPQEAKAMLRSEIIRREQMFCDAKEAFLARGVSTEGTNTWLAILDLVTGGNFIWSMTTARYILDADDEYPRLREKHQEKLASGAVHDFAAPIAPSLKDGEQPSPDNNDDHSSDSDLGMSESVSTAPTSHDSSSPEPIHRKPEIEECATKPVHWTQLFEEVGGWIPHEFMTSSTN